ncbi:MAG: response regulator [Lewinellaceae bacterium]|nr:response regulator [Lewinellaceae bacterium]
MIFFKKGLIFFVIFSGLASLTSTAQNANSSLFFDHLTTEEGLSYSRVRTFCQDQTGFIWIGTESGLNKFDGRRFSVWKSYPEFPGSLASNAVPALLEDSRGNFWAGTKNGLQLIDPDKGIFFPGKEETAPFVHIDHVLALKEDRSGRLWVGTVSGLYRINLPPQPITSPEMLQALSEKGDLQMKAFLTIRVWSVEEDQDGYIWIGTAKGLYYIKPGTEEPNRWHSPDIPQSDDYSFRALKADRRGFLWIGTSDGLIRLSADRQNARIFRAENSGPASISDNFITAIAEDDRGQIWIGSDGGGLIQWDAEKEGFIRHQHLPNDPRSLGDNNIEAIYADRDGGVWIGHHKGISFLSNRRKPFQYWQNYGTSNSLSPGMITCFSERPDGNVWIGIDDGGLDLFDRKAGVFWHLKHQPGNPQSLSDNDVISLLEDSRGELWIGSWGGGLTRFVPTDFKGQPKGTFTRYIPDGKPGSLQASEIWTIFEDRNGKIWLGSVDDGLLLFDRQTGTFRNFRHDDNDPASLLQNWVMDICEDPDGHLLVATTGGISRLDRERGTFENYPILEQGQPVIVYDVLPEPDGKYWIGTRSGLKQLDRNTLGVKTWGERDGLADNFVSGILKDDQGYLWLGTGKGLSKFDPLTGLFRNYDSADGLQSGDFSGAHMKASTGELFFGGINGFNVFDPLQVHDQPLLPPIVLTDFTLFNRSVPVRGTVGDTLSYPSPLERPVSRTGVIRLRYWQDDLSFEFAALNFLNPEKNQYKYWLQGYDAGWIETDARRNFANYTNLSPGHYTFHVIGSNNDGVWNEEGAFVQLVIAPPWWRTWWAYVLYVFSAGSLVFFFWGNEMRRQRLKHDLELKQLQADQLKELDETKTRLYTNITHEFRTPLTVILGMADQLEKDPKNRLQDGLTLIRRNGKHLLNLINQLLDLAKLQSNRMVVQLIQGDIVVFLKYIAESFNSMAAAKDLRVRIDVDPASIVMDFDRDKIMKITSNLLSNAIKFTPPGGEVTLRVRLEGPPEREEETLVFSVGDTGIGIPPTQLPHIFERFYQADSSNTRKGEGTGIGLALVQELVRLFQGHISVESEPGKGSTFTVQLPVRRTAQLESSTETEETLPVLQAVSAEIPGMGAEDQRQGEEEWPLLLVIEDNPDVRTFLVRCLDEQYRVATAENGQIGIDKALELIPDIIISDVMMPEKDGFEVCAFLKKDTRTSHIPIVMLTARAAVEDRIAGLERGADAYMAKPFHQGELTVQLKNLLESRRRLQERYRNLEAPAEKASPDEKVEDIFLLQLRGIIDAQMNNSAFSIEYLCRQMAMSRMQLHRKIKALTGRSTSLYIRSIRLQHARHLLSTTDMNVSEVAYEVGFDDPKYFSRVFSEEFGVAPSDFRTL